ncbi:hypothetical protein AB9U01_25195 [Pseudomonas qingdaonensis]|uniref:hypothetical protein n=1 Tax=Pseudomonas qingdaonensis TaxID=2056231 RepID=UPI003516207E
MTRSAYTEKELQLLVESQAVREVVVMRTDDGERWQLQARRGSRLIPIRSKRENPRTWASLDTLENFTRSIGIPSFHVESL